MSIAQKIKEKQDKDGMLRRALERIIQLYTDKAHFVFELLQNAEDAEAQNIKFIQYDNRLEAYHDGKPFTSANLQSLFDIGMSDKVDNLNQIGEFGVGFKSVFSICETVQIESNPVNFRNSEIGDAEPFGLEIINFIDPKDKFASPLDKPFTTKFVFPYVVGLPFSGFKTINELRKKLTDKLENLNATTLLFMKNLQSIEYEIHTSSHQSKGCYKLSKTIINDHCVRVQALSDKENTDNEFDEDISYLVFSKETDVFRAKRSIDIAFAFKKKGNDWEFVSLPNATISVFFPTETESKLKFIVQGPYRTTPNRSSVPFDDPSNIELAEGTAQLLYDSVLELKELGQLNLSFLRILPLQENNFYTHFYWDNTPNNLFAPIFDKTKELFQNEAVLPCRNGQYSNAEHVKLVRSKELADLFSNGDLSKLIGDSKQYYWLPEVIAPNKLYQELYSYLNDDLNIGVITPESLNSLLYKNSAFLESKTDDIDWLIKFYTFLSSVPALCSRTGNGGQMLAVKFVKNQDGRFVAPYRKSDDGKYLPNIFIPFEDNYSDCEDIDFVNKEIFQSSCQEFFTKTLGIEKPQEYDYWLKGLKYRYKDGYHVSDEQHLSDIKKILHFLQYPNYKDDLQKVLKSSLLLKCALNEKTVWENPYITDIYFAESKQGIAIRSYFEGVVEYPFIDYDFYYCNEITYEQLAQLNVKDTIISGDSIVFGEYDTGKHGTKPSWRTDSNSKFRWQLSILRIEKVLKYITKNPNEASSRIKSSVIFKILQEWESSLIGTVYISGQTPNIEDTCSKVISILVNKNWEDGEYSHKNNNHCWTNEDLKIWDGKWLFTHSGEIVSSAEISKHDLDTTLYGDLKYDSKLYEILKFKKDEIDIAEDNLKTYSNLPKSQKVFFGEQWLKETFGITVDRLQKIIQNNLEEEDEEIDSKDDDFEFPEGRVKNWDSLRRHTAELLSYASPVEYQSVLRMIRVSKKPDTIKAYLKSAYKIDGKDQFACQLCHQPFVHIEMSQLDGKKEAEKELDPMYLCLCPNCANKFNVFKNTDGFVAFRKKLESIDQKTIEDFTPVIIPLGNNEELWFTQVHIAEIVELLKLQKRAENELEKQAINISKTSENINIHNDVEYTDAKKLNLSKLKESIGKQVRYITNGVGSIKIDCIVTILNITDKIIKVRFEKGNWSNKTIGVCIELGLDMCLKNKWFELID